MSIDHHRHESAGGQGVITQVDETGQASYSGGLSDYLGSEWRSPTVELQVRGVRFEIDKEELLSLPESILLGVMPIQDAYMDAEHTGQHFGGQNVVGQAGPPSHTPKALINTISPKCLEYVLQIFRNTPKSLDILSLQRQHNQLLGEAEQHEEEDVEERIRRFIAAPLDRPVDVLKRKPAIILLKEDLDYYCIYLGDDKRGDKAEDEESISPLKVEDEQKENRQGGSQSTTRGITLSRAQRRRLKIQCGEAILTQNKVFQGLRNSQIQDSPEYHLLTMLCSSGFTVNDGWGFRERDFDKSTVTSLALVRLVTNSDENKEMSMSTPHKLLLFWRKPARKCWWDSTELSDLNGFPGKVRVYMRRVWTLELCVLGTRD